MDSINGEPRMSVEDEDRISNLPDDIIHRILSFVDMKQAVQTCTLSHRWKLTWTSIPNLNLNSNMFRDLSQFTYFVKNALARRNSGIEVSAVDITYTGKATEAVVKSIVNYAYSRNAWKLSVTSFNHIWEQFPQYLFGSKTLKYLAINNIHRSINRRSRIPCSDLDFPALETLYLGNIRLGGHRYNDIDLFSKCVNLKDLTLYKCSMYGVESFTIYTPQLLNLEVTDSLAFPMVFNVVAPQLKNLTASVITLSGYLISCFGYLRLSTEGFGSLDKVNLSMSNGTYNQQKVASTIFDLIHVVRNAKLLILDVDIIMCLSSRLDQLVQEPCPFDNLKCLKINNCLKRLKQNDPLSRQFTQVKNYLLENSPNATFIMDLPQVSHKRSRQHAPDDTNTTPLKVAKLGTGKKQPETTPEENRMLESTLQIRDQVIANLKIELQMKDQVIANLNANIQTKDQVIADQNADIEMNDQVTANLNANIHMKDQVIANQKENIQLKDQVIEKQKAVIRRLKSNNIHLQSDVLAPPSVP